MAGADEAAIADSGSGTAPLDLLVPGSLLVSIVLACFLGPVALELPPPTGGSVLEAGLPALSPGHILGTDLNGNDVLARLLHGGRVSLQIAFVVNMLGLALGGLLGGFSGLRGGSVDAACMRVVDVLIAFPSLVIVLAIAHGLGASQATTIVALLFFSVPAFARVARAETLRLRELPFVAAAELGGRSGAGVLVWHVIPNLLPQLTTFALLGLGVVVVIEGGLSFLGLGVPSPEPSWGNMIAHGQQALLTAPELVFWPAALLCLTVLSSNLLGEALRSRQARA